MPIVAVELDVRDAALARHLLLRVGGRDVAHLRDVGVPEQRVVVDRDLRVGGDDLALAVITQRVDLDQHGVVLEEHVVRL